MTQFATAKAGLILVNINPAYRLAELEYALNKVGCRALITATRVQDQRLCRHDQHAGAGAAPIARPGQLDAAKLPELRIVIQIGDAPAPGIDRVRQRVRHGHGRRIARSLAELAGTLAVRRCDQHPVHLRHHRPAEGRDADAPQHPQQRLLPRRGDALHRADRVCIPVPLYHCFGMVIGNLACITHGAAMVLSGRGLRSARHAADGGRGALHRALRRADHVHRRARASRVRAAST